MKIRGQPARSPKGLVVLSPHHVQNLPSSCVAHNISTSVSTALHFPILIPTAMSIITLQPLFPPIKITQHTTRRNIFNYHRALLHSSKNVPEPHPVNNVLSFKIASYYIVTNCTYHRNFIPLVPHKDQNSLPRSLKFRSFF